jgi:hypothetical protein
MSNISLELGAMRRIWNGCKDVSHATLACRTLRHFNVGTLFA